jgi:hypothetical protein
LPNLRPLAVLQQVRTSHQIAFRVADDSDIVRQFSVRHAAQTQKKIPEGHVKSNFLCNIGYGDPSTLTPRGPRLDFSDACTLL